MEENRRHLRYPVETSQLAHARFKGISGERGLRPVLVANLSYSGCNLIAIADPAEITVGDELMLQFDEQDCFDLEIVRTQAITSRSMLLEGRFLD